MKVMKKPELMAPAGDMTSLRAALDSGADAVYFGIKSFNMREGAKNFLPEEMPQIAELCHEKHARCYLALNTIIFDSEISSIDELIKSAVKARIDAIICWDFAVIESALRQGIQPFISTQMSVSNSASIEFFYRRYNIKRFVLARECSLDDIIQIRKNLISRLGDEAGNIEIEVFVHGAMCVSISGRCFMSQFQSGKSANRGECNQPCRREYTIRSVSNENEFTMGNNYIMSPKDLCTIGFLDKIIEAGVDSMKIEGRGRSPEYVSTVTSCYRRMIDFYFSEREKLNCSEIAMTKELFNEYTINFQNKIQQLKAELTTELVQVFNRGFSDGFFFGRPMSEWTTKGGSQATHRKVLVGVVTNFFKKVMVAEIKVEATSFNTGQELMFQGPTTGVINLRAESIEYNFQKVNTAEKGTLVGVKLSEIVRINDLVFIQIPEPAA
ncbi:MAG: U32 family peptidase [Candidatus Riflebacteria bacterium]|nr:U32 family peptidase [Candidatus Riflebacteria bacterium]